MRKGNAQPEGYPPKNSPVDTENSDKKREILIRNLWKRGTGSIYDVRVVKIDTLSHHKKFTEKCLQMTEKDKNNNYLESWLQQHRHFSPFVVLVDGTLGVEAETTLKHTANRIMTK